MSVSFRRAPDFERRRDMIEATLDCIADLGIEGTTVRAVAARAGISNGLIRHHFESKQNLIMAAYRRTIEMMTQPALDILEQPGGTPHQRLTDFVAASLGGPVADPRLLSVWATFISQIHLSPQVAEVHHSGYLNYRRAAERVIRETLTAEQRHPTERELERLGIIVNAVIDGLWLEGGLAEDFNEATQIDIGLQAVESLLAIKLPPVSETGEQSCETPQS